MKADQSEDEAQGGFLTWKKVLLLSLPVMLCCGAASHRPSSAHPLPSTTVLLRTQLRRAAKGVGGSMKSDQASGRKLSRVSRAGGVLGRCWS